MSISLREKRRKALRRAAVTYAVLAALCGAFSAVYLHFSYGESSPFLVYLFVPPLLLGCVPAALLGSLRMKRTPGVPVRRLWNAGVATLTVGFLVRAIINIAGRYTHYDLIYWVLSGGLFAAAILRYFVRRKKAVSARNAAPREKGVTRAEPADRRAA
ncbi:MAG TPA: hypothetical protein P5075_06550 [Eubacteriales bacterium]|nr:hypothetical protein [Eubacteriales bacterium]